MSTSLGQYIRDTHFRNKEILILQRPLDLRADYITWKPLGYRLCGVGTHQQEHQQFH